MYSIASVASVWFIPFDISAELLSKRQPLKTSEVYSDDEEEEEDDDDKSSVKSDRSSRSSSFDEEEE